MQCKYIYALYTHTHTHNAQLQRSNVCLRVFFICVCVFVFFILFRSCAARARAITVYKLLYTAAHLYNCKNEVYEVNTRTLASYPSLLLSFFFFSHSLL